jgi:protein SHQ1
LSERLAELAVDQGMLERSFFTEEESAQLAAIPYPLLPETISSDQTFSLLMGLVDILFAYVYDHLLTDGEPTVESSWTICTLSCTLSWLNDYDAKVDTFESVVRYSSRRALIYPYLRNLDLIQYCWNQVITILQQGRRCVIRCLLQVRHILDKSECHYLGNRLFVDHYLAWLQRRVTDEQIAGVATSLARELAKGTDKDLLGLNLAELESQLLLDSDGEWSEDGSESVSDSSSEEDPGSDSSESTDNSSESTDDDGSEGTDDSSESTDDSSDYSSTTSESDEREDANAAGKRHSDELLDSNLGDSQMTILRLQSSPGKVLIRVIEHK